MKTRTLAVAGACVALLLSACSPGELSGVLDEIPGDDLSQSTDPALRAAGESATVVDEITRADALLEQGIVEGDKAAVFQAGTDRPDDPKYDFYAAALAETTRPAGTSLDGDDPHWQEVGLALNDAGQKLVALRPDATGGEIAFEYHEQYLDALRYVILNGPGTEVEAYCHYLGEYQSLNTDRPGFSPDLEVRRVRYLERHADFEVCGG